jgi:hypothetical protein
MPGDWKLAALAFEYCAIAANPALDIPSRRAAAAVEIGFALALIPKAPGWAGSYLHVQLSAMRLYSISRLRAFH